MIDVQEAALIAHALGHEVDRDENVIWTTGGYRDSFSAAIGGVDDTIWTKLAERGLAELRRKSMPGTSPDNLWCVTELGRKALKLWGTRDALGQRMVATRMYYIEDSRQVVGNCVMWWGKNHMGYECSLDDAGQYDGLEATSIVHKRGGYPDGTDHAWPVDFVDKNVVRHVRCEPLYRAREAAGVKPPKRGRPPSRRRKDARA